MSHKWWVLVSVACGTFMATLDSSVVNIALPTLTQQLATDIYRIKWVIIVYLLVITCLLLPFGRISDQRGRKLIFQMGYLTFIVGSALCGLSPNLAWLVLFRMFQGIGAAMLMANGPAIITSTFSSRELGTALGTLAMVVSAGLVSGPSVGGFLISEFGWRSIFLINIPIGIIGFMLVHHYVKRDTPTRLIRPFDWPGTVVQTILLLLCMVLFDPPQISISGSFPMIIPRWLIGIFIILFVSIFVKVESQVKFPLFDLSLLRNQTFWTANLAGFLTFVAYSTVSVLMPFFLEEVLNFVPEKAGLFMTAIPLTIFVVAPISGRLSDRMGSQGLSVAGAFIGMIGLFAMSGIFGQGVRATTREFEIVLALSSIGIASGLFQSPNNSAIMGCVPLNKLGVASALLATVRNLGLVIGTGLATTLFSWRMAVTGDFVSSFHTTLFVGGFIGAAAMIAALSRRQGRAGRGTAGQGTLKIESSGT